MTLKFWHCAVLMILTGYISSEITSYRVTQKFISAEAQAEFDATWVCNYAASLSANHVDWHRQVCFEHEFKKHFKDTQP
jgi:hypothetical protein